LAPSTSGVYCIASDSYFRWIFTGSEDGLIRKYDFAATMNGTTPLPLNQRHKYTETVKNV